MPLRNIQENFDELESFFINNARQEDVSEWHLTPISFIGRPVFPFVPDKGGGLEKYFKHKKVQLEMEFIIRDKFPRCLIKPLRVKFHF